MIAGIAGSFIGPRRRRPARRHQLAAGVLGQRARSACSARSGPTSSCKEVGIPARGAASTGGATSPSPLGLILLLIGITYGIQPYGGHTMGWTGPWCSLELIGGARPARGVRRHRDAGRRPDVPPRPVPDPRLRRRQRRQPAVVDRARRPAVHADHLAAGHLAAAARLQLRRHAAVGRHLHAAAHASASSSPARSRAGCPTATARARSPPAAWSIAARQLRSARCCCPPTSPSRCSRLLLLLNGIGFGLFAAPNTTGDHELRAAARAGRGVGHARHVPEQRAWCCRSACSSR